jgi:hypothetical protein
MRQNALLYAHALGKLSDDELNNLVKKLEDAFGAGKESDYYKIREAAQAACIDAVIRHFTKNELTEAELAAFKKLGIKNLKEQNLEKLSESEFAKTFSGLVDIIKMKPEQSAEFFADKKNALLFGLTAEAQESRTTAQQVLRVVKIIALTATFIAGIALMATAIFPGAAGAVAAAGVARYAAGLLIMHSILPTGGISSVEAVSKLGISGYAASLGIGNVQAVAITLCNAAISPVVAIGIGLTGLGIAYGSYLGFPEDTTSKIRNAMTDDQLGTLDTKIGSVRELAKKFK